MIEIFHMIVFFYGALLLNFCMRVTEEDIHIVRENLDRSSLGRDIPLNALKLLYQRTPSP